MSPLKITTRDAATGPVLEIFGELDYDNATELRKLDLPHPPRKR